jgi:hypothetical protein
MSGRSSIDSLRRLSPVSDADAAAVFGVAGREELLAGLTRLPFGRSARPRPVARRRRRALVVALAVLVVAATAATWAVTRSGPARETTSIQCLIRGNDTIIPSTSGDPAHDCEVDYRREFGTAPPRLVAYDNTRGGVTVLPSATKPPVGWKPLQSQDVALIELQDSLDDYIAGLNSSCLDATAATRLAEARLARFGFTGWTINVRNEGACTNGDVVDPASKTVALIGSSESSTGVETTVEKLAGKLRPLTQSCESLPAAVAKVRAAAGDLGLSESARTYELDGVEDDTLRCASIYETVGGTIVLTVRGPSRAEFR